MIYRALECTVYGREHYAPMTVWFQADRDADAAPKVRRVLAAAWDVAEDEVCIGNVDSELALEDNSLQPAAVRKAGWFEVGGFGGMPFDAPFFDLDPQMVMLDSFERRRWDEARTTATAVARSVASKAMVILADKAKTGELDRYVEDLAAFAARGTS